MACVRKDAESSSLLFYAINDIYDVSMDIKTKPTQEILLHQNTSSWRGNTASSWTFYQENCLIMNTSSGKTASSWTFYQENCLIMNTSSGKTASSWTLHQEKLPRHEHFIRKNGLIMNTSSGKTASSWTLHQGNQIVVDEIWGSWIIWHRRMWLREHRLDVILVHVMCDYHMTQCLRGWLMWWPYQGSLSPS